MAVNPVASFSKALIAPLGIDGPIGHRLANLAISLNYFHNTRLYIRAAGHAPNYINPIHYTEKMQCRKLFDRNPLFTVFCDKLAARAYAEQADCGLKFPQIYWSGEDPAEIPFDDLPVPYILKPNHRCGALHVVRDRSDVNKAEIQSQCRRWLQSRYGRGVGEWGYRNVPRRIYAEELLPAPEGFLYPDDYKIVTIAGRVAWIEHIRDRGQRHYKTYFDRDWKKMQFARWRGSPKTLRASLSDVPRPPSLDRMTAIAEHLGTNFDQLRVDLYAIGDDIYFGELTIYEESGLSVFFPLDETFDDFPTRDLDREFGEGWRLLPVPIATKLARALFGKDRGGEVR